MARRRQGPDGPSTLSAEARRQLERLRQRIRESDPPTASGKRRLTEAEVMALAYAQLIGETGRLDWDAVEVVDEDDASLAGADEPGPPPAESRPSREVPGQTARSSGRVSSLQHGAEPPDPRAQLHRQARRLASAWSDPRWHADDWTELASRGGPPSVADARRLAAAASCAALPELNLRRRPVAVALQLLEQFVASQQAARQRFVRVITGKGIASEGSPVLKPAVASWCREHAERRVVGCTPERDGSGDYGALIVELRVH
ncbi:MAG: Smr/MutS family protein [Myxococcales bacterium FL481]|nr:MAG: Smr/MutS family protein [Myxococcales bacterium FL481]